jgi:hypothetical protein
MQKVQQLHERLKSKAYRGLPLRRIYIPNDDRKKNLSRFPLWKIRLCKRRRANCPRPSTSRTFLTAPTGSGCAGAPDEAGRVICREQTSVVLELDISIVREHLMEMIVEAGKRRKRP